MGRIGKNLFTRDAPVKETRFMRCWNCGFPRTIGYFFHWNDDGTISPFIARELRAVVIHVDMINNLLSEIGGQFGICVEEAAFNAQRSVMRLLLPAIAEKVKIARLMLDYLPVSEGAMTTFLAIAKRGGHAAAEVIRYKPRKYMVISVKNPFNRDLFAGTVVAAAEYFEECNFNFCWEQKSEVENIIRLDAVRGKQDARELVEVPAREPVSDGLEQRRCTNCGVPLGVSAHFQAIENEGLIIDRHTEQRVIFIENRIFMALFREISLDVGVGQIQLLSESLRQWTVDNMGLLGLKARIHPLSGEELQVEFEKKLADLPIFGLGCATESIISRSGVRVVVLNPFETELVGGMLVGIYEVLTGNKGRMTWEHVDRSVVAYTIK